MENLAWHILALLAASGVGAFGHWIFKKDSCSKCGIHELREDIKRLCTWVRLLSEHAGIPVKEQIEIDKSLGI